ncbi:hypothetical protein BRC76_08080 [Halobacteriales archaeon QH_8_67_36]|nr:MAG: hypothetical protein BRC76_08080 [Halobacteriales archaeon QH_8_67_36]
MSSTELTDSDEGKTVVSSDGGSIGVVSEVRGGRAYVDPDPNVTDKLMSTMGWSDADEEDFALNASQVDEVTDDEVRLTSDL